MRAGFFSHLLSSLAHHVVSCLTCFGSSCSYRAALLSLPPTAFGKKSGVFFLAAEGDGMDTQREGAAPLVGVFRRVQTASVTNQVVSFCTLDTFSRLAGHMPRVIEHPPLLNSPVSHDTRQDN